MPPAVELGQYLAPELGRACQLGDVLNNQIGVLLGWSLAAGVWAVGGLWPGKTASSPIGRHSDGH